jgi:hypothetical protein
MEPPLFRLRRILCLSTFTMFASNIEKLLNSVNFADP